MGLTRRFLFNDASWDETCSSVEEFRECLKFCFECLRFLRSQGAGLEVGHGFYKRPLRFVSTVREAVSQLDTEQKRRLCLWVDRDGPFWDRPAAHSCDEYFECEGKLVTETALAEAAHLTHVGERPVIVSLPKSDYQGSELGVIWHEGPYGTLTVSIANAVTFDGVKLIALNCISQFETYQQFVNWAVGAFPCLTIDRELMIQQLGTTIIPAIMDRGRELLDILNSIASTLASGDRKEYERLCQEWLRSERFSDSSSSEKDDKIFTKRMTFTHPETADLITCYWHGKVRTAVYRLHFEWPPPLQTKRLFVGYFGPKLTKQ